jgi:hypothetical protein
MKKDIQINYIFWKEGPVLFAFAQSRFPRLLAPIFIQNVAMEIEI